MLALAVIGPLAIVGRSVAGPGLAAATAPRGGCRDSYQGGGAEPTVSTFSDFGVDQPSRGSFHTVEHRPVILGLSGIGI